MKIQNKNGFSTGGRKSMIFDYRTLKQAAKEGSRLGNWNGKAVFAASTTQLQNLGSGAFYILYDDENKIVAKTQSGWRSYGEVTEQGSVNEYSSPRKYSIAAYFASEEATLAAQKLSVGASGIYSPGYDVSERPMGDVKLTVDVDKVLKDAREMTVDSLLEGFNYGLDEVKG